MYTFDVDEASAMVTYELVRKAYQRVFARLELPVVEGGLWWEVMFVCMWCVKKCVCVCVCVLWHI